MAINITKVDQMIAAIQAKDLDEIIAKHTYIPSLGYPNNTPQLQAWLKKRLDLLNNAKVFTEQQITTFMGNLYDGLTTEEQVLADEILLGNHVDFTDEEMWENVVPFIIYKYISE